MAFEKSDDFRILPGAYHAWERFQMPRLVEEVVDAVFGLPDGSTRYYRMLPERDLWCVEAVVYGWRISIIGERDAHGRWTRVREVHPHGR